MATPDSPVYINVVVGEGDPSPATQLSGVEATSLVSRSGAIIDRAEDYYVAVMRLAFFSELPLWIPSLILPSADGISLTASLTIAGTVGGKSGTSQQFLKLDIPAGRRILYQTTPKDAYTFVYSLEAFCEMVNVAFADAYADLIIQGVGLTPGNAPFFSRIIQTDLLKLTCPDYAVFAETPATTAPLVISFNTEAFSAFSGWPVRFLTHTGMVPSATGEDFQIIVRSDGTNFLPAASPPALFPAAPATTSITVSQLAPTVFPAVRTIRLTADLPTTAELVPGGQVANQVSSILTDFVPDPIRASAGDLEIYNAAFGDARWIKMSGPQPLTMFSLRLLTVDWQGFVRPVVFIGRGQGAAVKLVFAPRSLVETS
jgi:hypothetical protein